jgi:hypothetical protein
LGEHAHFADLHDDRRPFATLTGVAVAYRSTASYRLW